MSSKSDTVRTTSEPFGMQFLEEVETTGDVIGGSSSCIHTYTTLLGLDHRQVIEVDNVD
jgi:hypothetical protein